MRRGSRKTKPISKEPLRCIVFLSSDEEHDEYAAERKENKQLNRINEFAKRNNLVPMKIVRRGIMGTRIRNEFFYRAIAYMKAGKADAIVAVNLDYFVRCRRCLLQDWTGKGEWIQVNYGG